MTFAYNGIEYHGSQVQPNAHTVQAELEGAMRTILRVAVPLTFAGRTDAGVHAEQMVAHFDFEGSLPSNLAARLNNLLPASIAIHNICHVTDDAHARFDALSRTYHYRVTTRKDPFTYQTHTRVATGLDYDAMNQAAENLLGTHDCASFCRTHTDVKTTICTVREARWVQHNEYEATFIITADRFLRNMVRAVVGTLFEVGRGKMSEEEFIAIMESHDRKRAGHSASAEGLSLVEIIYPKHIYYES